MIRTNDMQLRFDRAVAHVRHGLEELLEIGPHLPGEVEAALAALLHHVRSSAPGAAALSASIDDEMPRATAPPREVHDAPRKH